MGIGGDDSLEPLDSLVTGTHGIIMASKKIAPEIETYWYWVYN